MVMAPRDNRSLPARQWAPRSAKKRALSLRDAVKSRNMESYLVALRGLGQRVRALRLGANLQQKEIAARAGVTVGTVQRVERTGRASTESLLRIAHALRAEAGFDGLFAAPEYATLDEALAAPKALARQRVRRRG